MYDILTPRDIELLAHSRGLTISEVCKRADVSEATFYRWKSGDTEPLLAVYRRIRDVVMPSAPALKEE